MAITKVTSGLISADASSIDLNIDAGTLYLDVSENRVGIGTTSPATQFHIVNADDAVARIESSGSEAGDDARLEIKTTNGTFTIQNDRSLGTSGALTFAGNTSDNIVIDHATGNVGIGTSSPSGITNSKVLEIKNTSTGAGTHAQITLTGSNGHTNLLLASGDDSVGGDPAISSTGNHAIRFGHATNATFSGFSEAMRIDSSGNLLVGTTAAVGKVHFSQSALDADVLQLTNSNSTRSFGQRITFSTDHNNTTSQFLKFKGNTTDRLVVYSNGNVQNTNNSYGALSDEKLKENIVDATDKLEDLKQVRIRNYNLIGEDKNQIGVIAQELETIFPSMVEDIQDQDAEGNVLETSTKSVKYSVFVPILIKAIQEQQTIIDNLKTRIETLESA